MFSANIPPTVARDVCLQLSRITSQRALLEEDLSQRARHEKAFVYRARLKAIGVRGKGGKGEKGKGEKGKKGKWEMGIIGAIFYISGCKVKYFSDIANMFKTPSNILLLQCRRGLLIVRHSAGRADAGPYMMVRCPTPTQVTARVATQRHRHLRWRRGRMLKSLNDGEQ